MGGISIALVPAFCLLLRNTNNLKSGAIDTVDKIGSLDDQRRNGKRVRGEERDEGK